ncbi:flagellar biosynthetic protein FliO [Mangrovibacillus cuniculi]|uniref:Flagellar biosynthesis protein FliZ n=1 Tax=Mangrovibacillus cuniculi TaxID=2593652 RepID=A0A7S8HFC0_9BACI|nr:flagellar biosynthetic protein FliO [Mangrovibacillus cuniculi]QPC46356.1 flagellar biosynthesis protein FliZ [Mangrovibacillus cuniculi]
MRHLRRLTELLLFAMIILTLHGSFSLVTHAESFDGSVDECKDSSGSIAECFGGSSNEQNEEVSLDNEKRSTEETANSFVSFGDVIRMIFALLVVIGLLYGVLKFLGKKSQSYQHTQMIQNLGGTSLGGNRSIQLVKIGTKLYVVGVGENVQLMKEIEDTQEKELLIKEYQGKLSNTSTSDIVGKIVERATGKKHADANKPSTENFSSLFQTQLKSIQKDRKKRLEDWSKEENKDE